MNTRFVLYSALALLLLFSTARTQSIVRFAVIGDYGSAGQPEADVSNLVKSWNPDFIITLGDNNYDNGAATTIDPNIGQYYHEFISPYTGSYGTGDTVNRFFPSLGNHDWVTAGATPYLNYFTLPGNERYYDFVKGPIHFYAIDSDSHEPDGISSASLQGIWLQNALASSTETWKIVYFHHPPYSSGSVHGSNATMQWPFKQWGATTVMAGHEHNYERLLKNNMLYFVNGLGGRSLYAFGTPLSGSIVRYNSNYGAMLVEANDDSINFKFINRAGIIIDNYTIFSADFLPPVQTTLVQPANASSFISIPAFCTWNVVPTATYYQLELSTVSNFASTLISDSTFTDTSVTIDNLANNTTYYWHVRAKNSNGWGPYSNTYTFTTWDVPGTVTLEYPSDASVGLPDPFACRWMTADNASMYSIEISPDSAFALFVQNDSTITDTIYSPTGLDTLTRYFWRVRAQNFAGWGDYSERWKFKISGAVSVSGIVEKGWNMVSLPMIVSDNQRIPVFPTSSSPAWAWTDTNGYQSQDTLNPGAGYWMKFDSAQTISITGLPREIDTINVLKGWNLIGSLSVPVNTENVLSIPAGIISSSFYEYSNRYKSVPVLSPFKGYWVKVSEPGKLILQ